MEFTIILLVIFFSCGDDEQETTNLSGVIRDNRTGEPLHGVRVGIRGFDNYYDYSDDIGHYQIPKVPSGVRELYAELEGYDAFIQELPLQEDSKMFNIGLDWSAPTISNVGMEGEFHWKQDGEYIKSGPVTLYAEVQDAKGPEFIQSVEVNVRIGIYGSDTGELYRDWTRGENVYSKEAEFLVSVTQVVYMPRIRMTVGIGPSDVEAQKVTASFLAFDKDGNISDRKEIVIQKGK